MLTSETIESATIAERKGTSATIALNPAILVVAEEAEDREVVVQVEEVGDVEAEELLT
jgi:hypothetical protein